MVDASRLRISATDYAEAEYQLSKIVSKEVPVDQDGRCLFFAEVERCEERVRAQSSCKDLDEGIAFNGTRRTTGGPDQADQTATQDTEKTTTNPLDTSNQMDHTHGVAIRGPLLPAGHLRKLVRIQGKIVESSVHRVHRKLRQLTSLIDSHHQATKKLPEAHDDVKEMLLKQAECVGKLHVKLDRVAHVLGDYVPERRAH